MDVQLVELETADRSLFPGTFTIRAIRDSRYHNTAYAIAELIDNSIEAKAEQIDLLCMESAQDVGSRIRRRVVQLAVIDNGTGMDLRTLFDALKFGGGTRHSSTRGIGKYGMGLPTSSMSQCKKVDVWTWQDGPDSAWHSSIDADAIEQGDHDVPLPDRITPIPAVWKNVGSESIFRHNSGTLVVWSELDKIQWKTGRTIIDHTTREVGRIHRHLIQEDMTRIRTGFFLENRPYELEGELLVTANDPLYLMSPSSTPSPWDSEPMFTQWGDTNVYTHTVNGKEVRILVKYSIVKPEALKTQSVAHLPGHEEHGKHARHNIGVSVVRENREIVLEDAFLREGGSAENPQNRWWGCEVQFTRDCDELFGLDHNKQMVANFTQAAKTLARDDRTNQLILDEIGIESDPIYELVGAIRDQTSKMMAQIRQLFAQRRNVPRKGQKRNPEKKAVETASDADREAVETGREVPTKTDNDREQIPRDEREAGLTDQFIESGQSDTDAQELAKLLVEEGLAYQFNSAQLDGFQMFNVRSNQGILHVNLNIDHPIYDLLRHIEGKLGEDRDENDPAFQSIVALRLLLSAWARMEDQTISREDRTKIQDIAMNWGRQANKFLSQLRERDE